MANETKGAITLAQQSGVSFIGNISKRFLAFLFLVAITHLVAPSIYGVFVLAVSIIKLLRGIASLRLQRSLDYFIPMYLADGEYGKAQATIFAAVKIGLGFSALWALLLWASASLIGAFFGKPDLAAVLPLMGMALVFGTANDLLFGMFNSIKRLEYRTFTKGFSQPGLKLITTTVLILIGFGLTGLVLGYILSLGLTMVIGLILLMRVDWIRKTKPTRISMRRLISYSLPLAFAGIIYATLGQIDFFVIGFYLPSKHVGFYRVGFLFASNVLVVIGSMKPIFKPMVAEVIDDSDLVLDRYRLATRWITLFTVPISVTIILIPGVYLALFFSRTYLPATTAVSILVVGYLVNSSFGPEGMLIEGLGHTRLTLLNTILIISTNLALDIILVPRLGIVGAAIGTAIGLSVGGFAGLAELYYLRGLHPLSISLAKIWIAGLIGGAIGYAFNIGSDFPQIWRALLVPIAVCSVYYISLLLTEAFTKDDEVIAHQIDETIGRGVMGVLIRDHQ